MFCNKHTMEPLSYVQGVTAIRSLEMASNLRVRGRDRKVFDNLEAVEVPCLSPRCQDEAHAPRLRLTINVVNRACNAVTLHPPAHPAHARPQQPGRGVCPATHARGVRQ